MLHSRAVLIRLQIDHVTPPAGQLTVDVREPVGVRGWLDLLRLLSEILEGPQEDDPFATPP